MRTSKRRRHRALRKPATLELIGWSGQPTPEWLLIAQPETEAAWSPWAAGWPLLEDQRVLAALVAGGGERS